MSTATKPWSISVTDYLEQESASDIRHEYLAGEIYAMIGGKVRHNAIAMNIAVALTLALKGKPCRAFGSDMKIRVEQNAGTCFYYPDVSVVCDSNEGSELFQDKPVVLVEVLSDTTRRTDLFEKKDAYLSIDSLHDYLLVEQDTTAVIAYSREGREFTRREYASLEDRIELKAIGAELLLRDIYEEIFPPTH